MRSAKDPRHLARVVGVMDLYNHYFSSENFVEIDKTPNDEDLDLGNFSLKLRDAIVQGVKEHRAQIDELINLHSNPVKVSDLDNLVLQILRVGVFEGFIAKTVPPKVAVDEAIELTRDFGQDMSSKKVGGILGKIFEKLVPKEAETA